MQWEQIFESQKNLTLESPSLAPAPDFGQDQHQKYSNREAKYKKKKKKNKERKKVNVNSYYTRVLYYCFTFLNPISNFTCCLVIFLPDHQISTQMKEKMTETGLYDSSYQFLRSWQRYAK